MQRRRPKFHATSAINRNTNAEIKTVLSRFLIRRNPPRALHRRSQAPEDTRHRSLKKKKKASESAQKGKSAPLTFKEGKSVRRNGFYSVRKCGFVLSADGRRAGKKELAAPHLALTGCCVEAKQT